MKDLLFDVFGRVVLITGGNAGSGAFIAEAFVRGGAKVYITSRHKTDGEKFAIKLTQLGPGTCSSIHAELATEKDCLHVAQNIDQQEKCLHVLVNNAAKMALEDSLKSTAPQQPVWESVVGVTMNAAFYLTKALLPLLQRAASKDDPARVINISSVSGVAVPSYDANAYIAAKAGLNHMTRALAFQMSSHHITVNAIALGFIKSRERQSNLPEDFVPLGRAGSAADVAGPVLFLSSRAGAYVTGQILGVDGGLLVKSIL